MKKILKEILKEEGIIGKNFPQKEKNKNQK